MDSQQPRDLVDGRFELRRKLGEGGFGFVYAAYDRARGAEVALKMLTRAEPRALFRFKQEFRALADVRHPNLVELQELFVEGEQWFFTMELVAGVRFIDWVRQKSDAVVDPTNNESTSVLKTLELLLDFDDVPAVHDRVDDSPLDPERLRQAFPQLVRGVRALHLAGKLHCDLKPSNVLVTPQGRVVLLDFGLVREIGPERETENLLVGTPSYMSPEQAKAAPLSEASDWYSAGVMLFEALTGTLPFLGSMDLVLAQKRELSAPAPSEIDPTVPKDLDMLTVELLRLEPDTRPKGADIEARLTGASTSEDAVAFVGRGRELERLRDAYARAVAGGCASAVIDGPEGSGMSTLAHRFLEECHGATVLASRCYEQESVPYKGVDGLIDGLLRLFVSSQPDVQRHLLGDEAWLLGRLFPVLNRLEIVRKSAPVAHSDERMLRERAAHALKSTLGRLSAARPLVLFIDDAHFGDADGAALLSQVLSEPSPHQLLVVLTCRSKERDTAALVRAVGSAERITLAGFDDSSAVQLVGRLLAGASAEVAVDIATEARGDPWLIRQLCRELSETGASNIDDMLERRMRTSSPEARRLLELIACAGRPVDTGLVLRAHGMPAESAPLASLCAERLVRARTRRGATVVEIAHYRLKDSVLRHTPAYARRYHHACIAEQLQIDSSASPETLAVHWQAASDDARAAACFGEAAELAERVLAFDRAARLRRRQAALTTRLRAPLLAE